MTTANGSLAIKVIAGFVGGVAAGTALMVGACGTAEQAAPAVPVPYVSMGYSADEADYLNALRGVAPAIVNGAERQRIQDAKRLCAIVADAGPVHGGAAVDDQVKQQTIELFNLDNLSGDPNEQYGFAVKVINVVTNSAFCK